MTRSPEPQSEEDEYLMMDKPQENLTAIPAGTTAPASPSAPRRAGQVEVDDSRAVAMYANFCRVIGTPEELILDFGLNPQPGGAPTQPIVANQRVIVNLFTAKRLLEVLQMTVQRHESAFGALETDVQRRVRHA
jgi:hypothetical protein